MSRVTYQITVWSIYRSTTITYFDNHKLGMRPIHRCDLYASIYGILSCIAVAYDCKFERDCSL